MHARMYSGAGLGWLGLVLGVIVLLTAASSDVHANVYSREDAAQIVTDALLGGTTDGIRLYVYPETISAGTTVATYKRDVFTAPAAGHFLFIDMHPRANWEHDCRYVFVDATSGALAEYKASVPPAWQMEMIELTDGRDNPTPEESARLHAWFDKRMAQVKKPEPVSASTRGQAYAFIISGGASQGNNHIRYWNDCSFIYKTLVNYYGYADENIYVCISDGTNPAPDRSDGTNSPPDLDGDGDDDIQYPATYEYIELVFLELASILTPSDQLFIYTTDHGGRESGWDAYLNLWNWEELRDDQLAAMVDMLPCETIIGTFEQCFSGGMIDDLVGEGRVWASAAAHDEYSWAMGPDYQYDTFVFHWTSAVNWEDPYGNPVDADLNGDGIISMREAFLYAEANDFEDETPQYNSTPEGLGEILNLMGNLEGVYLALENYIIDDDNEGASQGNGDGIIDFGETIELTLTLSNLGSDDASDVIGVLQTTSLYATPLVDEVSFGPIPSGMSASNAQPFVLQVNTHVPDLESLGLTVTLNEEPLSLALGLHAHAPAYQVSVDDLDDSIGGDGDGIAEPGETVGLSLRIENTGSCATPDLTADLGTGSEYFIPSAGPQALGVLAPGEAIVTAPFEVSIAGDCPGIFTHYLHLHLRTEGLYQAMVPLVFAVGQIFADDIEGGGASWVHYAGPGGTWLDEWHTETYRNHTPGGAMSFKCGGAGGAEYGNLLYACLETAEFELPAGAQLSFWHWMRAEASSAYPEYCYDGGLLEISSDGGQTWDGLTPEGGYPYRIRAGGTPGPFPAETPVWSGSVDWTEVIVDLSGYDGDVRLRWSFGSDGAVTAEGWYIDDVRVYSSPPMSDVGDLTPMSVRPMLFAVRPNPVVSGPALGSGGATIRFALPAQGVVELTLHDATGRRVRELATGEMPAGETAIPWDGRDSHGAWLPAGAYYYRLATGQDVVTRKLTLIR